VRFDIDKYKAISGRITWDDLDFDAFQDQPLAEEDLRCVQYMHDIEYHTVCYLRDLLVTRAHGDQHVTAFLTIWNLEELYHGEALAAVLAAHGRIGGPSRVEALRHGLGWKQHVGTLSSMFGSIAVKDFTAVHMMWGAVNEWTAQAGYAQLSRRADHPVLTELLKRIMRQEGRHVDFYASEAKRRLTNSRAAQRITRFALRHFWRPVGSGVAPKPDVNFMIRYLFGDEEGKAISERIDRRIQRLPGLQRLSIVADAREAHLTPLAA